MTTPGRQTRSDRLHDHSRTRQTIRRLRTPSTDREYKPIPDILEPEGGEHLDNKPEPTTHDSNKTKLPQADIGTHKQDHEHN